MDAFAQLIEQYPLKAFNKGQTILLKGESPKGVYIIEYGVVRAYMITADGAERLVAIHSKAEDIPIGYGIGISNAAEYFYEAYTNCRLRIVPQAVFERALRSDAAALFQRQARIESRLLATLFHINALEQPRAGDKIAFTLFYMASHLGTRLRPHKTRFKLAVTQQEIANALGLTRETAGMELKKLELKQLLSHSRKSYILYMERLRAYLDERT